MNLSKAEYPDTLNVKDGLQLYFSRNHFKDGGYNSKWFRIKLGPLYIPFPNTRDRVAAVKIHDIHHLITNYEANLKGESQIGAWEIASGCGKYYAAWILNFGSFFYGMIFYPRVMFNAFLKGRTCATNLYYKTEYDEALLNKTIGELRAKVELNSARANSMKDYLVFALCCMIAIAAASAFFIFVYKLLSLLF